MNTSTKSTHGTTVRGLHQLESKISELQKQHLLKERQQEITTLLTTLDLAHIDDKTLIGGFLLLKEKINAHNPISLNLVEV